MDSIRSSATHNISSLFSKHMCDVEMKDTHIFKLHVYPWKNDPCTIYVIDSVCVCVYCVTFLCNTNCFC